jgi:hypothetical protein
LNAKGQLPWQMCDGGVEAALRAIYKDSLEGVHARDAKRRTILDHAIVANFGGGSVAHSLASAGPDSPASSVHPGDAGEVIWEEVGKVVGEEVLDEGDLFASLALEMGDVEPEGDYVEVDVPLLLAAQKGVVEIVVDLLRLQKKKELTAYVNRADVHGWTALIHATVSGHEDILLLLLDHGSDPNHAVVDGNTALHFACQSSSKNIVKWCINFGADPMLFNKKHQKCWQAAKDAWETTHLERFVKECVAHLAMAHRKPNKDNDRVDRWYSQAMHVDPFSKQFYSHSPQGKVKRRQQLARVESAGMLQRSLVKPSGKPIEAQQRISGNFGAFRDSVLLDDYSQALPMDKFHPPLHRKEHATYLEQTAEEARTQRTRLAQLYKDKASLVMSKDMTEKYEELNEKAKERMRIKTSSRQGVGEEERKGESDGESDGEEQTYHEYIRQQLKKRTVEEQEIRQESLLQEQANLAPPEAHTASVPSLPKAPAERAKTAVLRVKSDSRNKSMYQTQRPLSSEMLQLENFTLGSLKGTEHSTLGQQSTPTNLSMVSIYPDGWNSRYEGVEVLKVIEQTKERKLGRSASTPVISRAGTPTTVRKSWDAIYGTKRSKDSGHGKRGMREHRDVAVRRPGTTTIRQRVQPLLFTPAARSKEDAMLSQIYTSQTALRQSTAPAGAMRPSIRYATTSPSFASPAVTSFFASHEATMPFPDAPVATPPAVTPSKQTAAPLSFSQSKSYFASPFSSWREPATAFADPAALADSTDLYASDAKAPRTYGKPPRSAPEGQLREPKVQQNLAERKVEGKEDGKSIRPSTSKTPESMAGKAEGEQLMGASAGLNCLRPSKQGARVRVQPKQRVVTKHTIVPQSPISAGNDTLQALKAYQFDGQQDEEGSTFDANFRREVGGDHRAKDSQRSRPSTPGSWETTQ